MTRPAIRATGRLGRSAATSLVTLVAFLPLAVGCTSNEYVIPHQELARLAATPPQQRGARVRVVQELGDRRGDPVPMTVPAVPPGDGELAQDPAERVDVQINLSGGGSGDGSSSAGGSRAHVSGGPSFHGGSGHGVSAGHGGGGGGGGGNGDAALVVLVAVIAVVVAVGLVSSEGVRFDGFAAISPAQPVHLRAADGRQATVPMADLTPDWVAATVEAKVMDDEGYGIQRLDRAPLDRRGGVFKLDTGTIAFNAAGTASVGPAMNVQAGVFFTRRIGLLASLGLAGASAGGGSGLIPRHALALELQTFPLQAGRFHLGIFANGGMALSERIANDSLVAMTGPSVGGGILSELDVTSRMALTLRAAGSLAKLDDTWTPAALLTAGLAVY
ncbi:MAG TPA: hypothetical protein VHO67_07940 [Polyangia bacterium]|nr:hypothetical protein [Polyangia bacterium]